MGRLAVRVEAGAVVSGAGLVGIGAGEESEEGEEEGEDMTWHGGAPGDSPRRRPEWPERAGPSKKKGTEGLAPGPSVGLPRPKTLTPGRLIPFTGPLPSRTHSRPGEGNI
jgi:hypothetical protein